MREFVSWSCQNLDQIEFSISLWQALCCRLSLDITALPSSVAKFRTTRFRSVCFPPTSTASLDGIIAHLTRECGGNVSELGIVAVTGHEQTSVYPAKNAAALTDSSYSQSMNKPDQWICYDFGNRLVRPTHSSIHAHSNDLWLRSWVIEGSFEGPSNGAPDVWTQLDHRENDQTTGANHPIATFPVSSSGEYRFIRLRQTGKNARGNDYLILFAFEVFGDLVD
jgi:hypothetical protein